MQFLFDRLYKNPLTEQEICFSAELYFSPPFSLFALCWVFFFLLYFIHMSFPPPPVAPVNIGCNSWNTEVHFALKVKGSGTPFLFPGNCVTAEGQHGYSPDTVSKRLQGQLSGKRNAVDACA